MSCSLYRWTKECDERACVGDCDFCDFNNEDEEETYTIKAESLGIMEE